MNLTEQESYLLFFQDYPDVVSVKEAALMLGVCTKTIYKLLKDGAIKHFKIGRHFKIPKWNVIIYLLGK